MHEVRIQVAKSRVGDNFEVEGRLSSVHQQLGDFVPRQATIAITTTDVRAVVLALGLDEARLVDRVEPLDVDADDLRPHELDDLNG